MAKENISAKFLIQLVSERPALWDKTSEEYKDREWKQTLWHEICTYINENYNSLQPRTKEVFTRMIMNKWTHIRSAWLKSLKYGYDEVTKKPIKPYIYHNEMKFMEEVWKCKPPRFNLNMTQLSNMDFEDFYRERNETQNSNSNGTSNELENIEEEVITAVGDFNIKSFKQEGNSNNNESKVTVVNEADDVAEIDNWQFDDADITPILEEPTSNKQTTDPLKKKRKSIFVSSHNEEELEETKVESPVLTKAMPPVPPAPPSPTVRPIERHRINCQRNYQSLYENRHWNFFKSILPSINNLDEDHVLQFQSGVIVLIQKLRESQKQKSNKKSNWLSSHSLCKGRGRKRKASSDERRSTRRISDFIAPENETEYSSEN